MNDYMKYYSHGAPLFPSGAERRATRTDEDVLRENYRYVGLSFLHVIPVTSHSSNNKNTNLFFPLYKVLAE